MRRRGCAGLHLADVADVAVGPKKYHEGMSTVSRLTQARNAHKKPLASTRLQIGMRSQTLKRAPRLQLQRALYRVSHSYKPDRRQQRKQYSTACLGTSHGECSKTCAPPRHRLSFQHCSRVVNTDRAGSIQAGGQQLVQQDRAVTSRGERCSSGLTSATQDPFVESELTTVSRAEDIVAKQFVSESNDAPEETCPCAGMPEPILSNISAMPAWRQERWQDNQSFRRKTVGECPSTGWEHNEELTRNTYPTVASPPTAYSFMATYPFITLLHAVDSPEGRGQEPAFKLILSPGP